MSKPETREPERCEACRRARRRGPKMHETTIHDVGRTFLCDDVPDCRRFWPHDAPGSRAA